MDYINQGLEYRFLLAFNFVRLNLSYMKEIDLENYLCRNCQDQETIPLICYSFGLEDFRLFLCLTYFIVTTNHLKLKYCFLNPLSHLDVHQDNETAHLGLFNLLFVQQYLFNLQNQTHIHHLNPALNYHQGFETKEKCF